MAPIILLFSLLDLHLSEEWQHILGGLLLLSTVINLIKLPYILFKEDNNV